MQKRGVQGTDFGFNSYRKMNFSRFSPLRINFDLALKQVMVNLGSSLRKFDRTNIPEATYYTLSPTVIALFTPEKKILFHSNLHGRGGHLGNVTRNICAQFRSPTLGTPHNEI